MKIVSAATWRKLKWRALRKIGPTAEWYVHHGAAGGPNLRTLLSYERFHVTTRGWFAPGYNFAITEDGTIYELRGWFKQGAHTVGRNRKAHAVCLVGDWSSREVPQAMVDALVWLTREGHRVGALRTPTITGGHRDAPGNGYTACPGEGGARAIVRARRQLSGQAPARPTPNPSRPAPAAEEDDVFVVKRGETGARVKRAQIVVRAAGKAAGEGDLLPKFGADGDYGKETVAAVDVLARRAGLPADGHVGLDVLVLDYARNWLSG